MPSLMLFRRDGLQELAAVIRRMLQKDPNCHYPNLRELREALLRAGSNPQRGESDETVQV